VNQSGFDFAAGVGFDTGRGQAGFDFSQPESAHSRDERERRRRNEEESAARRKREREQRQREESANRERQRQQDESRSRSRHSAPWESAWDVLGVPYTATKRAKEDSASDADMEAGSRLEAERCTWEFRSALRPQASQQPIDELPLFGGRYQGGLFE
jgi:hypothetical protein